jgi:hypothetical protein
VDILKIFPLITLDPTWLGVIFIAGIGIGAVITDSLRAKYRNRDRGRR